jgi:hypothetical protein
MRVILIKSSHKACIIANRLTSLEDIVNSRIKEIINHLSELLSNTHHRLSFLDVSLDNEQSLLSSKLKFVRKRKKYKEDDLNNDSNYVDKKESRKKKRFKEQDREFKELTTIEQNEIIKSSKDEEIVKTLANV